MLTLTGLFAVLIAIDMGLKQYVEDTMECGESKDLHLDVVELRKAYNNGFIFNLFKNHPDVIRIGSIAAASILTTYDSVLFAGKGRAGHKLGMAILSAGAASNLYDRLVKNRLVDYLGITAGPEKLQEVTFNLADVYIVAGTVLAELTRQRRKKDKK